MGSKKRRIPGKKKLQIVLEGLQTDNVAEFCRQKDIAQAQFYRWKNKLEEHGAEALLKHLQLWLFEPEKWLQKILPDDGIKMPDLLYNSLI